jgi:hypothetical protein
MSLPKTLTKTWSSQARLSLIFIWAALTFIIAFSYQDPTMWSSFIKLNLSPAILLTDYFEAFGPSATLLNAAIVLVINVVILLILKMQLSGLLYAAIFTVYGFSFLGMNTVNLIPIYIGGWVYAKYMNLEFKTVILVSIIAGTVGPIISHIMFGYGTVSLFTIALGTIVGIILGFLITPLGRHFLKFHDGFNLYNIGFTGGMLAILYDAIARRLGYEAVRVRVIYEQHDIRLIILTVVSILLFLIIGFLFEEHPYENLKSIFKSSGRAISDFIALGGFHATHLNMALVGIMSTALVFALGGYLNGLTLAGIFTIIAFGAFGKHPKNILPPFIGAILSTILTGLPLSSSTSILSILFASTLAPIAGVYGFGWGIVAGFLHVFIVNHVGMFYSGLNLYNNGFAGGLGAGFLIIIIGLVQREKAK